MLLLAAGVASLALALFANITGWTALARIYRLHEPSGARARPTGGVVVGDYGWNAPPLRVALDETGIVLAPMQPFRLFFPEIRVPWSAVTKVERREYLFFDVVRLHCASDAVIGFLPSAATAAILERLGKPA